MVARPTDLELAERYAKLTPYEAHLLLRAKLDELPKMHTDHAGMSTYLEDELAQFQRRFDEILALIRRKSERNQQ